MGFLLQYAEEWSYFISHSNGQLGMVFPSLINVKTVITKVYPHSSKAVNHK